MKVCLVGLTFCNNHAVKAKALWQRLYGVFHWQRYTTARNSKEGRRLCLGSHGTSLLHDLTPPSAVRRHFGSGCMVQRALSTSRFNVEEVTYSMVVWDLVFTLKNSGLRASPSPGFLEALLANELIWFSRLGRYTATGHKRVVSF